MQGGTRELNLNQLKLHAPEVINVSPYKMK
jgi:hypothetical protein